MELSPKELEKELRKRLEKKKKALGKIKKIAKKERTFENTVFALEKSNRELGDFLVKLDVLLNMSPKKQIREKAAELEVLASQNLVEINFDEGIFRALKDYKNNGYKKEKLEEVDRRLFKEYFKDYQRMGFALPEKEQKELKEINKKISELSSKFSVNINNWEDYILLNKKETAGLDTNFLNSLKKEKGK